MIAANEISGSLRLSTPSGDCPASLSPTQQEAIFDADLVRRFNAGEAAAFDEIVARYRPRMFALAFSMLRNRADAEEIAQDTFVRAFRGLGRFRGDSSLSTWLHRIALNLSRNRYWHGYRRCQHLTRSFDCACSDDNPATLASRIASTEPSPVQEVVREEFTALVSACMGRLGLGHREILTQRNLLNRTYDEIAATLGISIGTVKSRIARARQSLRQLLAQACPEFAVDSSPGEWFDSARAPGRSDVLRA